MAGHSYPGTPEAGAEALLGLLLEANRRSLAERFPGWRNDSAPRPALPSSSRPRA